MNFAMYAVSVLGIVLSLYILYVGRKLANDSGYKAACDISSKLSCTQVISSSYSHLFGISNAIIGIAYYFLVILFAYIGLYTIVFGISLLAMLATIYLFYLMHFRIRKYCIVCNAAYLVNFAIFILSFLAL
ncbi:hypothetical protein J4401_02405 [Candidatus Woesearchaeota archaeon]|nr:hypothetical protein [Candidatus Woesearchaeota archaeon]